MPGNYTTNFKDENGVDLGSATIGWIEKDYYLDVYSSLLPNMKSPGLWTWGYNFYGQLGNNTGSGNSSPAQTISAGANWKQSAAGYLFTSAIKTDGTLWIWGDNTNGSLGDNTIVPKSSPIQIGTETTWRQISSGNAFSAAVKTDGTLWTWGKNDYGQLGDNTAVNKSSPVQVTGSATTWKQIATGYAHFLAVKTDGTLWSCGYGIAGQLGNNASTSRSSPVQIVGSATTWKQASCGRYVSSAIKTDGTLWTWGSGSSGVIGNNSTVTRSSPVQTIAGGSNWEQVSCGYSVAAIKTDGTLWTWGDNTYGALGDNSAVNKSSPVQTVAAGTNWKFSYVSKYSMAIIKTDGTLWGCGYNGTGTLGDGSKTHRSSPVQSVASETNWKQVSVGDYHMAGIRDFDI